MASNCCNQCGILPIWLLSNDNDDNKYDFYLCDTCINKRKQIQWRSILTAAKKIRQTQERENKLLKKIDYHSINKHNDYPMMNIILADSNYHMNNVIQHQQEQQKLIHKISTFRSVDNNNGNVFTGDPRLKKKPKIRSVQERMHTLIKRNGHCIRSDHDTYQYIQTPQADRLISHSNNNKSRKLLTTKHIFTT